jgi:hypothetical protein
MLENLVPVMDVLHFGMDRPFGTDFPAQAASDAESFFDPYFHDRQLNSNRPERGSALEPKV